MTVLAETVAPQITLTPCVNISQLRLFLFRQSGRTFAVRVSRNSRCYCLNTGIYLAFVVKLPEEVYGS